MSLSVTVRDYEGGVLKMSASTPYSAATTAPIAHLDPAGEPRAHLLIEHLTQVGRLAADFAAAFASGEVGRIAGELHDVGKFSAQFQKNIRSENGFEAHIEGDTSGPRDHSTAGAILAKQLQHLHGDLRLALAFIIAGHHAGLGNIEELRRRLENKRLLATAVEGGCSVKAAEALRAERPAWLPAAADAASRSRLEMWTRMLFSCLCDADFLDTEAFYDARRTEARRGWDKLPDLSARLSSWVDALASQAPSSSVNSIRAELRTAAIEHANNAPGFFTLTVPTGGGKTLTGLEFALHHANRNGLQRVIVAVPLTAIIEQTAEVYRRALGDLAVLEHHSAVDPLRETPRTRVASENWDAPIVVTTTVQLFESLFGNRTSACRKLHNVAESVLVLDEAQALPVHLLNSILDGLKTLVRDYGCSVVFSTATQPAFGARASFSQGIEQATELAPAELQAFERLKRVRVEWPSMDTAPVQWPQLAEELSAQRDVLAIVHRRSDARELALLVDQAAADGIETLHLSALMCPEHRSRVLTELKLARKEGRAARVVATQLIEAGVDVDFPVVYRALGGLDSVAQAAGRCNREGRLDEGVVKVFIAPTKPPVGLPRAALGVTRALLRAGPLSIDSPADFRRFFEALYPVQDLDRHGIQEARSKFDFRAVGRNFRMVEDDWSASVVVPWGNIDALRAELVARGANRETYRRLQRLSVNVPRKTVERWLATSVAEEIEGATFVVPGAVPYDERFGLRLDAEGTYNPGSLVIDE